MRILSIVLSCLVLAGGCTSGPLGSGSINGLELGVKLRAHLSEIQPTGMLSSGWNTYSAHAKDLDGDGPTDLDIVVIPLRPGSLAVAVDGQGVLTRARLWGSMEFDEDPDASWENFWRQFEYRRTRHVIAQEDTTATEHLSPAVRDFYRHTLAMQGAGYIIRRTMAVTGRGDVPPLEWYKEGAQQLEAAPGYLSTLRAAVGSSDFRLFEMKAADAAAALRRVASIAENGRAGKVRSEIKAYRRAVCGSCHGIDAGELDIGFRDRMMEAIRVGGATRNLYRVGVDVWGVPGQSQRSQKLADAIRLVMTELRGPRSSD